MRAYPNNEEFYIFGYPIETEVGNCHFLTVGEYLQFSIALNLLSHDKNKIIYILSEIEEVKNEEGLLDSLKELSFFSLINNLAQYKEYYIELFSHIFRDKDIWKKITEDNFESIRDLIMKMSCIPVEETSANPEIQKWLDKSTQTRSQGGKVSLSDLVTSICIATGSDYGKLVDWTYFQLQMTYKRISKFKDHELTRLFATFAEKVDIVNWGEHIPYSEEDETSISKDNFTKTYGDIMNK